MVTTILTAPVAVASTVTKQYQYQLQDMDRRALLTLADKPDGKISRLILSEVERLRLDFIQMYGNELGL